MQGTVSTLEMETLIAKSPTMTTYDTKEGAYQAVEKVHGASAIDPAHQEHDKEVYRVK